MATLHKRLIVALNAGVWAFALGSAVSLAYVLNRPLEPRSTPDLVAPAGHSSVARLLEEAEVAPAVVVVPPITVVASRPRAVAPVKPPEPLPDIDKMKCDDWRELQMGSGRVQICE